MTGILAACVLMWAGFTIGMRINAYRQAKQIMYVSTSFLRDRAEAWLIINYQKSITEAAEFSGVSEIQIPLSALDKIINEIKIFDEMKSYIINPSGKLITNPDNEPVTNEDFFIKYKLETYRNNVLFQDNFYNSSGKYIISSMKIPITGWTLISILPIDVIYKTGNRTCIISVIITAAGIVIYFLAFMPVVKKKLNR